MKPQRLRSGNARGVLLEKILDFLHGSSS
jgi:hypothetical protein